MRGNDGGKGLAVRRRHSPGVAMDQTVVVAMLVVVVMVMVMELLGFG